MRLLHAARLGCALLVALFAVAPPLQAQPRSAAEPTLLLFGKLGSHSATGLRLDLATLQKLPQHSVVTRTPWTPTPQKYSGPLLRDVLAVAQASGNHIEATALSDQVVSIPAADAQKHDVIVAHLLDDKPIPVRELGPLLLIYPFDSKPELQTPAFYRRSMWQLKSLRID